MNYPLALAFASFSATVGVACYVTNDAMPLTAYGFWTAAQVGWALFGRVPTKAQNEGKETVKP